MIDNNYNCCVCNTVFIYVYIYIERRVAIYRITGYYLIMIIKSGIILFQCLKWWIIPKKKHNSKIIKLFEDV